MQARRASEGIRIAALTKTAANLKSTAEICICRAKHYWHVVLFVPTAPVPASVREIGQAISGIPAGYLWDYRPAFSGHAR